MQPGELDNRSREPRRIARIAAFGCPTIFWGNFALGPLMTRRPRRRGALLAHAGLFGWAEGPEFAKLCRI